MPTTRPRHTVTETVDIAHAIDAAAIVWPELRDDRAALLRRIIERGAESIMASRAEETVRRITAIRQTAGTLPGVYRSGEAQLLREEWPE